MPLLLAVCGGVLLQSCTEPQPVLTALVRLQIEVYNDAKGKTKSDARKEVIKDVQEAILPTFASIIGTFETSIKEGTETCKLTVNACANAGSEFGCCDITVGSVATTINQDAVAEASAPSHTCTRAACRV